MRILFVHQNFPGQFKFLATALAADPRNEVVAFTMNEYPSTKVMRVIRYKGSRSSSQSIHPWASDFEAKVIRGEGAYRAALKIRDSGFTPDVIIAHPGWGESLFLKDVWPKARLGLFCEFYYHSTGADVGFDPEFPIINQDENCRIRLKNANILLHLEMADAGISPTHWQASQFPEFFRKKITVIHDGIDTHQAAPDSTASITINSVLTLTRNDEVVTFANRNLEPSRAYHIFMRALPEIMRRRPKAKVLIVGDDGIGYGAKPPDGNTWKEIFYNEVKSKLDPERVHFMGKVPYQNFLKILQVSTVHVYGTYPHVLSWSLLEAMSIGCAIVASDTAPLHEVISHDETGKLVGFFDIENLAEAVCGLLEAPAERERLGNAARNFILQNYNLHTSCLPRQLEWVKELGRI